MSKKFSQFTAGGAVAGTDKVVGLVGTDNTIWTATQWGTFITAFARDFTVASIVSVPAVKLSGSWYTGGSATTTKPHFLIEPAGTTSTGWSTSGTGLGINSDAGFLGRAVDVQQAGVTKLFIRYDGLIDGTGVARLGNCLMGFNGAGFFDASNTTGRFSINTDTFLTRAAAAEWQHGSVDAASPVAQTIRAQSVVAGTTNTAGVDFTFAGSRGTGTGLGGDIVLKTGRAGSTGSAQNATTETLRIKATGAIQVLAGGVTVANLPAAVQGGVAFVTDANTTFLLGVGTTVAGGGSGKVPVYSDGTNWIIG